MAEEKFLKLEIDQADFAKAPKQEQIVLLAALNILNEIYILQKCVHFTVNSDGKEELLKQMAASFQAFFFVRLLASVVYEAEKIIRIGFYGSGKLGGEPLKENLVTKYDSFWTDRTKRNFRFVDRYFRRKETVFGIIRNRFGFHYSFRDDTEALNKIRPDEWNLYLNEAHGTSLHQIALAVGWANLMSQVKHPKKTNEQSLNKILKTITTVSSRFTDIFGEYLAAFCKEYLSNSNSQKLLLANVKKLNEVNLPFFVSGY